MKSKKAVVDKVFVYVFSIIVVGFAGLLVGKFVFTFMDDVDDKLQSEFYENLERDYNEVYRSYGSENVLIYKVHQDVKFICFIPSLDCLENIEFIGDNVENYDTDSVYALIDSGDNIVMFDNIDIMNSYKLGSFNSDNNCFCVKPNMGKFNLILENIKNKVYINEGD